MALPLVNSPQLLSPDDVFGKDLANLRLDRLGDSVSALAKEHTAGEEGAGEHDTVQIAKSVFVFRMPHYDPLSSWYGSALPTEGGDFEAPLRAMGPSAGWRIAPTLLSRELSTGGSTEPVYFIDAMPAGSLFGAGFTPCMDDTPTWTSGQMYVIAARRTFERMTTGTAIGLGGATVPRTEKGLRIYLGPWSAVEKLIGGVIVVHSATARG